MSHPPPLEVEACVFDAYGTLFDFASAARACRGTLGERADALSALWRDKQLQYTWLRAAQGRHADFWQVTGDALDYALEALGIDDPLLHPRLMDLYRSLKPFAEVGAALAGLKRVGMKMAILSNGTPSMLDAAVRNAGLEGMFDAVLSVEAVGVFKPDPRVYQLAVDRLRVPAAHIAFLSSNAWDAWAASAFGMRAVWCNRYRQPADRLPGAPEREIDSLAALPEIVQRPVTH